MPPPLRILTIIAVLPLFLAWYCVLTVLVLGHIAVTGELPDKEGC